ncbi:helix-turn-helix domain-containing protein [Planctomicrobium piriforme]|uniref:HTH cro/C1-type domain-containing protein n=1 Tax=Planctomicrobium piriforme TaxID=1576369 RepID=A0A1I3R6J1_9PLAN|nr:helix-turn-helix transcriptional regulator [Planctomicrobium piriforme]SFJ41948.1 hypothetical protein SAMN05421753_12022 [Planctomicrobium piriforme]
MSQELEHFSSPAIATKRLNDFLERLLEQGFTQAQIAGSIAIPPQYLSDIKRGERPVTELIARRLGEEFDFNYRWLLGSSSTMELTSPASGTTGVSNLVSLPLFPFPIEGEPRQHPKWKGSSVELAGIAAGKVGLAKSPYVLQFRYNDPKERQKHERQKHERLKHGDLILISQAPNPAAAIHVVRFRQKSFLARASADGSWTRVATGDVLPSDCPATGHCIGVVWSALT